MLVGLIPTGKMELRALGLALQQIFPGHKFETISKNRLERLPFPGFTSNHTLALYGGPLRELVGAMVAAAMNRPDRSKTPDLVVVVEDAELFHCGNPEDIVTTFRGATQNYLQETYGAGARVHQVLRTKVSFHIVMPMIESWLFADPEGPRNAGASFPADWRRDLDPERFLTEDSLYLTDDGSSCEAFRSKSKQQPAWLPTPTSPLLGRSSEHPKWYLSWLCRNPESKNCSNYRETKEGANALGKINWKSVLGHPEHCTFLRSLIEDLRNGLGTEPSCELPHGREAACTSLAAAPADRVLRNI